MTAYTVTGQASTGRRAMAVQPYLTTEVVDFSATTNAAADTFAVLAVPANSVVLRAGIDVLVADTAGNSGTVALGETGGDVDRYVAAAAPTSTGQMTCTATASLAVSAADTIDILVATGAINAKVRVWAVICPLQEDYMADTDGQATSVVFA